MNDPLLQPDSQPIRRAGNRWMITFADVLALVLTFFVMLYAMNDIREDEWHGLAEAMAGQFNPANPPSDFRVQAGSSDMSVHEMEGMDLGYLRALIETQLDRSALAGAYQVSRRQDGLHIHLPEVVLVRDGQMALTQAAYTAARELGQVLRAVGNGVSVHGAASHGAEGIVASAWDVSLTAALMVADVIRETGYERKILALGHGDAYLGDRPGGDGGAAPGPGQSWGQVDIVVRDVLPDGDDGGS